MYDNSACYFNIIMTIYKSDIKHKIKYIHYIVLQDIIFSLHLMTQVVMDYNYNIIYRK